MRWSFLIVCTPPEPPVSPPLSRTTARGLRQKHGAVGVVTVRYMHMDMCRRMCMCMHMYMCMCMCMYDATALCSSTDSLLVALRLRSAPALSCCRARMRAGSSSGAKECHYKYQRLNKALVRTWTRFVVRRALVAPLRLASRLALHRHRLTIMRARSSESTIGCSHCAGCRDI